MTKPICLFFSLILLGLTACQESKPFSLDYDVVAAPEWDALFKRNSGWFGGDGIFVIPLSGKENTAAQPTEKSIILFSDTMIGEIEQDSLLPGYHMVNNSIAIINGSEPKEENIEFFINANEEGKGQSLFVPSLPTLEEGEYYWLGDGFVNPATQNTHIFAYRVVNRPEYKVFGFDVLGGALITIPANSNYPYVEQRQVALPFFFKHDPQVFGSFGAGVLVNTAAAGAPDPDGYIYIYGVDDPGKQLILARAKPQGFEDLSSWRFWDGGKWNEDFTTSAPLTENVSNELSVSFLPEGRVLLVSQVGDLKKSSVGIRIGESLTGPFGPMKEIWSCEEAIEAPEFIAYNAKAHPNLSKEGELLISYNVNSLDFWNQIEDYPHLYRPRFIKMIFK